MARQALQGARAGSTAGVGLYGRSLGTECVEGAGEIFPSPTLNSFRLQSSFFCNEGWISGEARLGTALTGPWG